MILLKLNIFKNKIVVAFGCVVVTSKQREWRKTHPHSLVPCQRVFPGALVPLRTPVPGVGLLVRVDGGIRLFGSDCLFGYGFHFGGVVFKWNVFHVFEQRVAVVQVPPRKVCLIVVQDKCFDNSSDGVRITRVSQFVGTLR